MLGHVRQKNDQAVKLELPLAAEKKELRSPPNLLTILAN